MDIQDFIDNNITNKSASYIGKLIDNDQTAPYGTAGAINSAIRGFDVRDALVKQLLLIKAYLDYARSDIANIQEDVDFIDELETLIPNMLDKMANFPTLTYNNATRIPENSNLDYITGSSTWYYPYSQDTGDNPNHNIINRPTAAPFIMYTLKTTGDNRYFQVAFGNSVINSSNTTDSSSIFVRRKIDANHPEDPDEMHNLWSAWKRLATWSELSKRVANTFRAATNIPSGANLDDYITGGTYCINSSTLARTIENCPKKSALMLHVFETWGAGRAFQIAQCYGLVNDINSYVYIRRKIDDSTTIPVDHDLWSPWTMVVTNDFLNKNAVVSKQVLTEEDDLNNVKDNGIYYFYRTTTRVIDESSVEVVSIPKNAPSDLTGTLIVYRPDTSEESSSRKYLICQTVFSRGFQFYRYYSDATITITGSHWTQWNAVSAVSAEKIRVMQYNIGAFRWGWKSNRLHYWEHVLSGDEVDEKLKNYKEFFAKYQPDLLGLQEYSADIGVVDRDTDRTPKGNAWNDLFSELFAYVTSSFPESSEAGARVCLSNRPLYRPAGIDGWTRRLYYMFEPFDSDPPETPVSSLKYIDPTNGTCRFGTKKGRFGDYGTVIKGSNSVPIDFGECFIGGRRVAFSVFAGPTGDGTYGDAELVHAYGSNITCFPIAPLNPAVGEVWYKPGELKWYDGSNWSDIYTSSTPPENPIQGQVWYQVGTNSKSIRVWNHGVWDIHTYIFETVYPAEFPDTPQQGMAWYSHGENSGFKEWSGTSWVDHQHSTEIINTAVINTRLSVFQHLVSMCDKYDYAIVITDSNSPYNSTGLDSHGAVVSLLKENGYKCAIDMNGYWGAKQTYVRHGEEQVFLDNMEEYLTYTDFQDRYDLVNSGSSASGIFSPIDNIFVKGNIMIRNVEVLAEDWEKLSSDHIPVIADLIIR